MDLRRKLRNFSAATCCAALLLCAARPASADVAVSITIAPPVLPVYVQPPCPVEGYIWNPGYWAWDPEGYYWVPGVWVAPPRIGLLWTPGYWGFANGIYLWHPGYWGPHVGFYGGVNYGYGFFGVGFVGGFWAGSVFRYNTAIVSVNTAVVRNVYVDRTVIRNVYVNRVSFNGPGGVVARPTPQEAMYMREQHIAPVPAQIQHEHNASLDRTQYANFNHGRPQNAAMANVNERRWNQQQRIANGVASGQLTPRETAHIENREANINREIHSDRRANGGTLTPQERRGINEQQNRESRQIERDKHNNARETPPERHEHER